MRLSEHLRLLMLATAVWMAFWAAGLPDYYQQYSFTTMAAFSIALVPVIVLVGVNVIAAARIERRKMLGFWLSLYFTAPLVLFDYLYCGLYLRHGWEFLGRFWYLTVYYFIPWFIFVPIGRSLARPDVA